MKTAKHLFVPCLLLLGACLLACLGCADESYRYSSSEKFDHGEATPAGPGAAHRVDALAMVLEDEPQAETGDAAPAATPAATANRKIIYDTTIGLVVEDYQRFESQLPSIVAKHGGFVSHSDTDRSYNDQQRGTWVIRVPVDSYTAFLSGIDTLGFAESRQENAQDVTEEYVDVEARIASKQALEQRIIQLLEDRSGKLADVLEIERELARVREEIERMEGRLRVLQDRTRLATVTINCREQKAYRPPAAPTLGARIRGAWGDSLHSLRLVAENLLVILIAAVPWMLVLGIPLLILWRILQRVYRRYQ